MKDTIPDTGISQILCNGKYYMAGSCGGIVCSACDEELYDFI